MLGISHFLAIEEVLSHHVSGLYSLMKVAKVVGKSAFCFSSQEKVNCIFCALQMHLLDAIEFLD